MEYVQAFAIGAVFSFVGSIPPGSLNICVMQLGLEGKINAALRFALAVSIIEYPYTWIAIQFESWVTASPMIVANFQLLTASVVTALGILTLWSARKPTSFSTRFKESGFRRGLILSVLNPMAIPFWIGITAYLKAQNLVNISTPSLQHSYISGTSVGVMVLLTLFAFSAQKLGPYLQNNVLVKLAPGLVLMALGIYGFGRYFW